MYYYTYCIEFLQGTLKNKKYFGRRKSKLEPGKDTRYIGSGVIPKDYFKHFKPSKETYIKTILNQYNSLSELIDGEQKLLNEHVGKEYCVNFNTNSIGGGCNKDRISVTNGKESYYIEQNKIYEYLSNGFKLGRHDHHEPWNKGLNNCYTKEQIKVISNNTKKLWENQEYRNKQIEKLKGNKRALGHRMNENTKKKMSDYMKQYWETHESPWKNKHHTEESKRKMSEKLKGKSGWLKNNHLSDWCKKNLSEKLTNTKLMNNGVIHKFVKIDKVDEYINMGWKFGHINKISSNCKKMSWITDGKINMRVKKEDLEEYYKQGYYSGRVQKSNS